MRNPEMTTELLLQHVKKPKHIKPSEVVQGRRWQLEACSPRDLRVDLCMAPSPQQGSMAGRRGNSCFFACLGFFGGSCFQCFLQGTKHLSFFYELVYLNMCESILTIFPDRKFQISWQHNDTTNKGDQGLYSLSRVDKIDYKRPDAQQKDKDHLKRKRERQMYKSILLTQIYMNKQTNKMVFSVFTLSMYVQLFFQTFICKHSFIHSWTFTGYSINEHVPTHFTYLILTLMHFITKSLSFLMLLKLSDLKKSYHLFIHSLIKHLLRV